ncbi:MAG: ATP-binding cassette domain-containing protein [Victivallales bacterium]|nr:ATP-binding cassette domain-containing protein [Victivallales bacterium]
MDEGCNIIECRNLALAYGQDTILANVNLDIKAGWLLPFVGVNGAGKSTLFKALLGLLPPRSGEIRRLWGKFRPGYVPQQQHIDPIFPVTVRSIVGMGLYTECGPLCILSREQKARLDAVLEHFGLVEHQRKTFAELSGGLRQKTLIARAVIGNSPVIFLDEPVAGLDAVSEAAVLDLLIDLCKKKGKTILLAHHRLEDLSRLSPMVCLVEHGMADIIPSETAYSRLRGGDL